MAKFHGDRSTDGGGNLAKEKKTSRAKYKTSRTTVTGGLIIIPRRSVVICRYIWKKDGEVLDIGSDQSKVIITPPGGSIIIKSPTSEDDGVYQCFARNELGTAVSITTKVQKAGMYPFFRR